MKLSPTVRASLELLGVELGAGSAELKKAYHRLAMLYHPDRNPRPEAIAEFRKVTEAYELLSDPVLVADLNRRHLREKLHRQVVEGFDITFGSFFGYRLFDMAKAPGTARLALTGKSDTHAAAASRSESAEGWAPFEENNSILDNPAYDAIEVVYAGKFSSEDEDRIKGQLEEQKHVRLPWVVLNNQGILRFLDGDLRGARKCYQELCERIPNNIVFMYRLGLCHILEGFRHPRRTLLGVKKPDRIKINKGVELLRHCIKIGETRPVGRQRCLVIRKVLADVYERTGRGREAKALWKDVLKEDPACAEAALKVKGFEDAAKIARAKSMRLANRDSISVGTGGPRGEARLGPGRGRDSDRN